MAAAGQPTGSRGEGQWRRSSSSSMPCRRGRRQLLRISDKTALEMARRNRRRGGGRRHRVVRVLGRALRHPEPHGPAAWTCCATSPGGEHPRLPGEPVQPPRDGAAVRHLRHAADPGQQGHPSSPCARVIHDDCPRNSTPGASRSATATSYRQGFCLYRSAARGRRPRTTARWCPSSTRRGPGPWDRRPVLRLLREGHRLHRAALLHHRGPGSSAPGDVHSHDPVREPSSRAATGIAGLVGGALVGAGIAYGAKLSKVDGDGEAHEEEKP